tara:strand:+ start:3486 stop:3839 length:354 start_codon:yes stop_codon:yes gene_type:complete
MARQIKIDQIAGLMKEEIQHVVEATALSWTQKVKLETPVDTNRLRSAWQTNISELKAEITNNTEYAEPVIYGNNLPNSWGGRYRTRQGTQPGFPDRIAKEITVNEVPSFIAAFRRRN